MIYAGKNIRNAGERMTAITLDCLYESIRSPKTENASKIRQLRIVKSIDEASYREQKTALPYFVCANFNPSVRKTIYFAYTEYFVLDIDHISGSKNGKDMHAIRSEIQMDESVVMCFLSPSADGLKVMFRLKERCYDHNLYSIFYKEFAKEFSEKYELDGLVDIKTSDVARACFISMDPDIYYNPEAEPICMGDFIDLDSPASLSDIKKNQDEEIASNLQEASIIKEEGNFDKKNDLEKDVLDKIRAVLDLKKREKISKEKYVYVPSELDEAIEQVREMFSDNTIEMYDVSNIQYGKRIKVRVGTMTAEMNLFYGKNGFSVVSIPRKGTYADLNVLASELLKDFMSDYVA